MRAYVEFEISEGAYEISCPDATCPAQGAISLPEIANLTTTNLLKKHHRYRLNRGKSLPKRLPKRPLTNVTLSFRNRIGQDAHLVSTGWLRDHLHGGCSSTAWPVQRHLPNGRVAVDLAELQSTAGGGRKRKHRCRGRKRSSRSLGVCSLSLLQGRILRPLQKGGKCVTLLLFPVININ